MKRLTLLLPLLFTMACGGDDGGGNFTGPSSTPQVPVVSGNYSGTMTVVQPEVSRTVSCPVSTSVNQNGSTINVAPLVTGGSCGTLSVPLGSMTIDNAGSLRQETGSYSDPTCGVYSYAAGGGFFGREMRLSWIGTSRTCLNMNITIIMTR